jgi:hypothetical protein
VKSIPGWLARVERRGVACVRDAPSTARRERSNAFDRDFATVANDAETRFGFAQFRAIGLVRRENPPPGTRAGKIPFTRRRAPWSRRRGRVARGVPAPRCADRREEKYLKKDVSFSGPTRAEESRDAATTTGPVRS